MPKAAPYKLVWLPEAASYWLYTQATGVAVLVDDQQWLAWLEGQGSFSFQGQSGQVSLLKELRSGVGYWYAYRRQGKRTVKQYAGRTSHLTFAHLETIAAALHPQTSTEAVDSSATLVPIPPTAQAEPLLAPKLQPPRLHTDLIARARLRALLDAGSKRILTLLCAPAGFGKTTLVRQWLAALEQHDTQQLFGSSASVSHDNGLVTAWVALDAGDNDPIRFWRYVCTACRELQGDNGSAALAQLQLPPQPTFEPSPLELALTTLLNELTHTARRGILVLDDYHLVTAPRIHETVSFFLDHLPATLHTIIITRHQPPLPLARLRVRGDLVEVSASELRFTPDEAIAFLHQANVPLPSPVILRQLEAQLEGWPAGLRLLALALRGTTTPTAIVEVLASIAGSRQPILDYFVTEVLNAQPAVLQDFLLRTSVLSRLNGELCDAVLGTTDSADRLNAIDRANLFLEQLDQSGPWYRYHGLFAEAMQAEARRRLGVELLRQHSHKASHWYEQHGLLSEAIETALRAQDMTRAADLLERLAVTPHLNLATIYSQAASEFHTLRRWLEQLPDNEFEHRPLLFVSYATALLFISLVDQVPAPPAVLAQIEGLLQRAEAGFQATDNMVGLGQVYAFRAMVARERGAISESVHWAHLSLAHLPDTDLGWRSIAFGSIGIGALQEGALREAESAFKEAFALCERIGNRWWTRANSALLSYVLFERGSLQQANAQFQEILAEAREQNDRDDVSRAQLTLASIAYELNDLETVRQAATEALELGEHLADDEVFTQAALILARAAYAQGQTVAAFKRLTVLLARFQIPATQVQVRLAREVRAIQAWLQYASGDYIAAGRWAEERAQEPTTLPYVLLERELRIIARLYLAQGRADSAIEILTPMRETAQQAGRMRTALEIECLSALAYAAQGKRNDAIRLLRTVSQQSIAEGYQRLFLDEGEPMHELLRAVYTGERELRLRRFLQRLLYTGFGEHTQADPAPAAGLSALIEPLSTQEQRVLRLLAAGHSNPEIARELVVSVNTVRTQVQSIYRKLGVNNRVAASEYARQLGLL